MIQLLNRWRIGEFASSVLDKRRMIVFPSSVLDICMSNKLWPWSANWRRIADCSRIRNRFLQRCFEAAVLDYIIIRIRFECVDLMPGRPKKHCFNGALWFGLYVAVSWEPSIVSEEEAGAIVRMRIARIYWEMKGADTGVLGMSLLEVFSSKGGDLICRYRYGSGMLLINEPLIW